MTLRVVCVSDTHNSLDRIDIPPGDVLVHAGDLTMRGTLKEIARELHTLASLPHGLKILVAGNHDRLFQQDPGLSSSLFRDVASAGLFYLEGTSIVYNGVHFWGSPWSPEYCGWAFGYDRADGEARWREIPAHTDVLITHGPPHGYGDLVPRGERVGCVDLLNAVARVRPRYHVFGHIHCGRGMYEGHGAVEATTFINAACLGEDYRVIGEGVVFDVE